MKVNVWMDKMGEIRRAECGSSNDKWMKENGRIFLTTEELTLPPPPPKMVRKTANVLPYGSHPHGVYVREELPPGSTRISISWDEPEETK